MPSGARERGEGAELRPLPTDAVHRAAVDAAAYTLAATICLAGINTVTGLAVAYTAGCMLMFGHAS